MRSAICKRQHDWFIIVDWMKRNTSPHLLSSVSKCCCHTKVERYVLIQKLPQWAKISSESKSCYCFVYDQHHYFGNMHLMKSQDGQDTANCESASIGFWYRSTLLVKIGNGGVLKRLWVAQASVWLLLVDTYTERCMPWGVFRFKSAMMCHDVIVQW